MGSELIAFGLMGYWLRAHSGSRNNCQIFRWRQKSKTSSTDSDSRKKRPYCLFRVYSSRRESLTTLTPFFLSKSSNLFPFFFSSCIFIFAPNVSYIYICQQRRVPHCMNICVNNNVLSNAIVPWKMSSKTFCLLTESLIIYSWYVYFTSSYFKPSNHVPCISILPLASVMGKKA